MEKSPVADGLTDQKIPNWAVKTTFLGETEIATRLVSKLQFGDMGLAHTASFEACCFFHKNSIFYIFH